MSTVNCLENKKSSPESSLRVETAGATSSLLLNVRRFCNAIVFILALICHSTLARQLVLILSPDDVSIPSSSESAVDSGDASNWDDFGDFEARFDEVVELGSWGAILDLESKIEDDAVYYSGVAKMIAAASSGGAEVMEEAASEIEAAATARNPHSQSALGFLYEMGMMRKRNKEKALMYHHFAADGGNTQSKMALAYTYSRQEIHDKAVKLCAELAEIAVNSFPISKDSPMIEPARLHNGAEENKLIFGYPFI